MGRINHESSRPTTTNWLAVSVAVVSLGTQIGVLVVWGGRIHERVGTVEKTVDKYGNRITDVERENAKQDTAIASDQRASKVAYEDIIRRLASIETKLDNRR